FFQAEDGIRYFHVTGVQTCALPISGGTNAWRAAGLKAAIPTILGDALKGAVAIWLFTWLFGLLVAQPAQMTVDEAVAREAALRRSEERRVGEGRRAGVVGAAG